MRISQKVWKYIMRNIDVTLKKDNLWYTPNMKNVAIACPEFFYMNDKEFEEKFKFIKRKTNE